VWLYSAQYLYKRLEKNGNHSTFNDNWVASYTNIFECINTVGGARALVRAWDSSRALVRAGGARALVRAWDKSTCLTWQISTVFFWWLSLPATHCTSICRITVLHILHFIPRVKYIPTIIHCSLYTESGFVYGRSAPWMSLGPSQPPTPPCILYIDVLGGHCISSL